MDDSLTISNRARRAIEVMRYLLKSSKDGRLVTADSIGQALGISVTQLTKVLRRLADAGQIISRRGRKGGFAPRPRSKEASLLQIIELMDGPLDRSVSGPLRGLRESVTRYMREHLGSIKLGALIGEARDGDLPDGANGA